MSGGGRGGAVDADPHQFALGLGDLLGSVAQQGQRRAPGDQPAEVGGEAAVQVEAEGSGHVPGGERPPGTQVHYPFSGVDAPPQLGGVRAARRGQVRAGRAGRVGRAHVRVVGGEGVEPGEQLAHVPVLGQDQHRVDPPLPADRGGAGLGLGGRAEAAEPVGGIDVRVLREHRGQAVRRGELGARELVGMDAAEQVGPAGRAVEQRPAGEHRVRVT